MEAKRPVRRLLCFLSEKQWNNMVKIKNNRWN